MCFVKDLVKFLQGSSCRIRFRLISQDCTASRFHGWDSVSWLPLHTVCHYFLPPGYFFPGHVETEVCWGLYLNPIRWTTSLVIPSLSPSIMIWHYLPRKSLFPYALKAGSIFPSLYFMLHVRDNFIQSSSKSDNKTWIRSKMNHVSVLRFLRSYLIL